ncbi:hypothetical protein [Actinophytocola sp.]|uniref:hypothetical protein n=1 Tax=Actinophytocola sp. TaxID=1872138 RepID=UPI002D7FA2D1|nr:hypothetical protein [Actinophytocola sp.]HET9139582.1 hypothetical protein [Actinophytocola sp.]
MGKTATGTLFAVAVCALLVAIALTVTVLTDERPERADAAVAVAATRLSPTTRPVTATRAAGPPLCLIGTWRSTDEVIMNKFYTDQPPIPLVASGRILEFRPDGTATERLDGLTYSGTFRGNQLRLVGTGVAEFTWHATDRVITYPARTGSTVFWSFYDHRGLLSTTAPDGPNPTLNEDDPYTCQGNQFTETGSTGYRGTFTRVAGAYG